MAKQLPPNARYLTQLTDSEVHTENEQNSNGMYSSDDEAIFEPFGKILKPDGALVINMNSRIGEGQAGAKDDSLKPTRLSCLFDEVIPPTLNAESIVVGQSFGDRDLLREVDRIGAVDFSQCGNYLLSGDNGGRIVVFANQNRRECDRDLRDDDGTEQDNEPNVVPNAWQPFYQFQGKWSLSLVVHILVKLFHKLVFYRHI
jgi:hypothetical protein